MIQRLITLVFLLLTACNESTESAQEAAPPARSAFALEAYRGATLVQTGGQTVVLSTGGSSGIILKRELSKEKIYGLKLEGTSVQGIATLRVTLDGIRSYWTLLPTGTFDLTIADASSVELLIYADEAFEYRLSSAEISECATCKSTQQVDDELRARIVADVPPLSSPNQLGQLEIARLLTAWTAANLDHGWTTKLNIRNSAWVEILSPGRLQSELWDVDAGGTSCYGFAVFLDKIFKLFGIEAFVMDIGLQDKTLTHVTNVVVVHEGASRRYYAFDPTFNGTILDSNGDFVDIESALSIAGTPSGAQFRGVPFFRSVILTPSDLITHSAFFAEFGPQIECSPVPQYFELLSCTNFRVVQNYIVRLWEDELRINGVDPDNLYIELIKRGVISISQIDNESSVGEFREVLRRLSIPN